MKRNELQKRTRDELTQEAKEAKKQETDILEGRLKSTMKRVAKSAKKCTSNDSQVEKTKSKTKSESLTKKEQKTTAVKSTDKVVAPVAKSTTKTTKPKKVGELQGQRKVPEPSDQHGCTHSGLMELIALPKAYLETYVKVGGWLYRMPCKDCACRDNEESQDVQVMDVSTLLVRKGRDIGYYCNCGPTGHKMGADHAYKPLWTCDMVLCTGCYGKRVEKMSSCGRRSRRHHQVGN
jgi:glucan-binding YG repeat protein